jgi:SNF2 family DNA or RNA helicase
MQIIDNKALVLRTRDPNKYAIIPKSQVVNETNGIYEIAVRWGLDEVRVLRNLGVRNVPSPITAKYDWPGRFNPMSHQVETAAFLTMHKRAFVFSEPGTGKTLAALWTADYLMKIKRVRRCLILCPLSIMQSAWMQDLHNSVIHRSAIVAHHQQSMRRLEMVQGDYEFVITNYDGLNLIADEVIKDGRFDLVIVDEANAYKNVSTKRWKSLNKIVKPEVMLWMMTGTPAAQSPLDAYGLAKLVNPLGVPKFFTAWRDSTMNKVTMFKWLPKADAQDKIHQALQPAIRFTKEQCLDLPPVVTVTRDVPLTPQQKKYYNMLKEQMLFKAAGETITAINAAGEVNKLLQIINNIDTEVIHGDVSVTKRTRIFKQFQEEPDPRVLVIQPQAAAHGVTLTAADTVVFWGPVMSTETYIQCCARSDRKGQSSDKVTIIHIQGSEIERKMFKRLAERVDDNNMLVKLYEEVLDMK